MLPRERGPSTPGDATWVHRFFNTLVWASPGGDFVPAASASTAVGPIGSYVWSSAQLAADVEAMASFPASNFGWLLTGNESMPQTTKRFDSHENAAEEFRPALVIEFERPVVAEPVPAVSAVAMLVLAGVLAAGVGGAAHRSRCKPQRNRR